MKKSLHMKKRAVILLLLLLGGLTFGWSQHYYAQKYQHLDEQIVMHEYSVLDKAVWEMKSSQKEQLLAQEESFGMLKRMENERNDALHKSRIGFWLSIIFGAVFVLYFGYTTIGLARQVRKGHIY